MRQFKDTLTSGSRMQLLMGRLAATKGRVKFNGDLRREYGYREGMWTTSNVLHYWRARILIKMTVSREAHIKKISDKLHYSPVHSQYMIGYGMEMYDDAHATFFIETRS